MKVEGQHRGFKNNWERMFPFKEFGAKGSVHWAGRCTQVNFKCENILEM